MSNWLVCGTRVQNKVYSNAYKEIVFKELDEMLRMERYMKRNIPDSIIEGCCPDSADQYAEDWATINGIKIQHHPSTSGNYLRRNIEMVKKASLVIAFWDGFSYGTAHTIATAIMYNKPVIVTFLDMKKVKVNG